MQRQSDKLVTKFKTNIMQTFNLISYESVRTVKRIQAASYDQAVEQCENKGYYMDDYFLETTEETEASNALNIRAMELNAIGISQEDILNY